MFDAPTIGRRAVPGSRLTRFPLPHDLSAFDFNRMVTKNRFNERIYVQNSAINREFWSTIRSFQSVFSGHELKFVTRESEERNNLYRWIERP